MVKTVCKMQLMIPLIVILLCSTALGTGLNDIIVTKSPQGTKVILICDAPTPFKHYKLAGPSRIFIECAGLKSNIDGHNYRAIKRGGVVGVSISRFERADFSRVIIETDQPIAYTAVNQGDNIVVTLKNTPSYFTEWRASESRAAVVYKPPKEQVRPATATAPVEKTLATQTPAAVPRPRGRRLVSMDLEGADLLTVLRALAEYSGRNIVAGRGVGGTVTVSLRDVDWETALRTILRSNGLAYIEENEIIRIATPAEIAKLKAEEQKAAPMVDKVYRLEFATVDEIATVVGRSLSNKGHVEKDVRTNSLVVTDIMESQNKIRKLISVLDSPTPQVEIAVKVVDMSYGISRDLGIYWRTQNLQSRRFNVSGEFIIGDTIGLPQVFVGTVRDFARIDAQLRLFESQNKARVVANPRVTAVNNREASILAGQKFTIIALDQRGNPITQLYTVGTLLRATPHINSLEEITMDIHAEMSEVDEASVLARAPIITTSEADTRQLVKDGETVVLGGFIREVEASSESGIPILKDIPLLGRLFKSTATSVDKRELVFFITPNIIKRFD
ncbi:MAG: secretin N-terminal domain-containing protein [bacterium]